MKIDFALLDTMAAAGASADAVIAVLKLQYARGEEKRKRDKENMIVARAGMGRRNAATKRDKRRQDQHSEGDNERQSATTSDKTRIFALAPRLVGLGLMAGRAGAVLGQWCKITHDNADAIESAIAEAERKRPADAIGYVRACLQQRNTINGNGIKDACAELRLDLAAASDPVQGDPPMRDITPGGGQRG